MAVRYERRVKYKSNLWTYKIKGNTRVKHKKSLENRFLYHQCFNHETESIKLRRAVVPDKSRPHVYFWWRRKESGSDRRICRWSGRALLDRPLSHTTRQRRHRALGRSRGKCEWKAEYDEARSRLVVMP